MTTAPVIPAQTQRAVSEWLARGYAVKIGADGSLEVKPPVPQEDLDLIDFGRRK